MGEILRVVSLLFLEFILIITTQQNSSCHGNSDAICFESERNALLMFKKDLEDPSNMLSSWSSNQEDCCKWAGVVCDNVTGHVQELHLMTPPFDGDITSAAVADLEAFQWSKLSGKINPSLLHLKYLTYLNLSNNNFEGIQIPKFLGSMTNLRYLDLYDAQFMGMIPHELGNLSSLRYLRISGDYYTSDGEADLQWLSGLSYLEHLGLYMVNLSKASDWLQSINMLPSLSELHLSKCQLDHIPSLPHINFTSLTVLDMSSNNFHTSLPNWVFNLGSLTHLDLKLNQYKGEIPSGLRNITGLTYLDLTANKFNSSIPTWLFTFTYLEFLDLGHNSLQGLIPSTIGNLSSLTRLDFSSNELQGTIPKSLGNLCNLKELDLSSNQFAGLIPSTIGNLSSLTRLDFPSNELQGTIPKSLGNLCNLKELDLGSNNLDGEVSQVLETLSGCISHSLESLSLDYNNFSGELTDQLGLFQKLVHLSLHSNSISGPIPESLGQLTNLESFFAYDNLLEGVVSETHFTNLINLGSFYASGNRLVLKVDPDWIPHLQLTNLDLSSWHLLDQQFPKWLNSQKDLEYLDLSCTGISDSIPTWFWNISSRIYFLNLSHNQIYGEIPYIGMFHFVYLESNKFSGPLPLLSSNVIKLDLSNNSFSGNTSHFFCNTNMDEPNYLRNLHLGENHLSGEIPNCQMNWPSLEVLKLENNNLTGIIPSSIGYINALRSLHLRNNSLSGNLPLSLKNCTMLATLDLGENKLLGNIPSWIGSTLTNLMILNLRSNKFNGEIPSELCRLSSLQILDLAYNNLSGTIPRCVNKLEAMVTNKIRYGFYYSQVEGWVIENAFVMAKGREVEYDRILPLVASFDLSSNNLSGEVPEELTLLLGLFALNLSNNHLTGKIPVGIGDMLLLESLDLSRNQLSGDIPPSVSRLTFMSHLNLSHNNLTGRIPSSTQLQSLNDSNFVGNHLCGPPLKVNCSADREAQAAPTDENEGDKVEWFYLSMGLGFVVGFWGVFGPILFKRSWRYAYFVFLDLMWYKLCDFCRKRREI